MRIRRDDIDLAVRERLGDTVGFRLDWSIHLTGAIDADSCAHLCPD